MTMAKINKAPTPRFTHEGARASHTGHFEQLRRAVLSCLLWEDTFYEDGESIVTRIKGLVQSCDSENVAALAIQARTDYHLRHVPLMLAVGLARKGYKGTADVLYSIIQRPDELTEFLALYWQDGKCPLSAQVKKGLARAFTKFGAYQLAKYNRNEAIKLRDVLFLVHAKPKDDVQAQTWKHLVEGTLSIPDTWETNLSAGKDKKETFTRLITEGKLGYMALLRNLRNMEQAGVDHELVSNALVTGAAKSRALPYRFIAALNHAPGFLDALDAGMQGAMTEMEPLPGSTVICIDVSGSMSWNLSNNSQMRRQEAAAAVAILIRGICKNVRIIGFGSSASEIPAYKGLAIADKLRDFGNVVGHGTDVAAAVKLANGKGYDRIIVITDEQSRTNLIEPLPDSLAYIINVASYENGIGYGRWTHINGFSQAIVQYIQEMERIGG
jgi:hypothetical protein